MDFQQALDNYDIRRSDKAKYSISQKDKWNLKMDVAQLKKEMQDLQDTASKLPDEFVDEMCATENYPFDDVIDDDTELENWCDDVNDFLNDTMGSDFGRGCFYRETRMKNDLFLDILLETKANAIRHHTFEEASNAVAKIKQAIKAHRFEILNRDKNLDFMHHEHLNKETSCQIIDMYLEPKNLICILPNRNKDGEELYLFSVCVPVKDRKKYIYLKCEILPYGKVVAISWHGQNEMIHPDYRQATDKTDDDAEHYLRKLYKNWERTYNKFNDNKMIDWLPNGDEDVTIVFEHRVSDEDKVNICRSVPKDYGYKYKDIEKNMIIEGDCVKIHLPFGKF